MVTQEHQKRNLSATIHLLAKGLTPADCLNIIVIVNHTSSNIMSLYYNNFNIK